jgi:putative transposase
LASLRTTAKKRQSNIFAPHYWAATKTKFNRVYKAHAIKLKPTRAQEVFFRKACGTARFVYNWALSKRKEDYDKGVKWGAYDLSKHFNTIKRTEYSWVMDVGKTCCECSIQQLHVAFKRMWRGSGGYPKFKKRGINDSFVAVGNNACFKQQDYKIWIPRLGWVKCCENLRFEGSPKKVTIKRKADQWFACINIEVETPTLKPNVGENQAIVGVDFGIKSLAILSDGKVFENPKALKTNLKSIKRLNRSLSRKQKGSKNRKKAQMRLARKHLRVSNIRANSLHEVSNYVINNYGKIVIEDLNVRGMGKNRKLAQAISDVGFGELRRQLVYKAQWQEKELVVADRYFASSKTCSNCGKKKETLKLSERMFSCDCGLLLDRDLNAARNLASYSPTPKSGECEAFGEGSSVVEIQHSLSLNEEIHNQSGLENG